MPNLCLILALSLSNLFGMKRLKDINWNHLYCFYEVARAQSLKNASIIIGLAASTVSEQLKRLEDDLELTLFRRSSKGLFLTSEGEKLYIHAKEIFETGSKLLDNISHSDVGGYPVTVGIEESISSDVTAEFVSQYWDVFTSFGTVHTLRQVEHSVLADNLLLGKLDWGITMRPPKRKGLSYQKIGGFELSFMCASELFERFKEPADILKNIPLAQNSWDEQLNQEILDYLRGLGIRPRETFASDHSDYVKKLCLRGRCVMYMAENPLQDYDGLTQFQVGNPLKIQLYAVWNTVNDNMLSIKKLKELIGPQLSQTPERYEDLDLQIEVSEVSDELLKSNSK